ncbi:hypothetical protein [Streptomyces sp. UNOC14_S4]|uniref:hypothetical protein n=1 Tax=Streptomyces sp. UNOC14_S4 TaxID=2872340 RepID=UPI001E634D60|nr:hypothetical protein [Streptomyces sp. UNOC14_S4]MCC3766491.1 hypothetical protein [Streptomyces sp. UNOC14_S4]
MSEGNQLKEKVLTLLGGAGERGLTYIDLANHVVSLQFMDSEFRVTPEELETVLGELRDQNAVETVIRPYGTQKPRTFYRLPEGEK